MAVTLSLAIFATTSTWAQSAFGGGTGTNTDPYIISTADHLRQLSEDVMNGNSYYEIYFRQTEDIDFEGATFLPIGGNYVREKGGATSFLPFPDITMDTTTASAMSTSWSMKMLMPQVSLAIRV